MADWIGDYQFDPPKPLANGIADGLPDLLFNGFDLKPPPLLVGAMVPLGNGYALAWTKQVPQVGYKGWSAANVRIPNHDKLNLGDQFTFSMRILYGGYGRGDTGYNLIQLNGDDGQPVLTWYTTKAEELAVTVRDSEGKKHTVVTTSQRLLPKFSRWYDLTLVVNQNKLTLYATPITLDGALETQSQSFDMKPPAQARGPMQILRNTNSAIERLRISDNALSPAQVRQLSHMVHLPGPHTVDDVTIGLSRQLFLDEAVIESMDAHVQRVFHRPDKHPDNPLVPITQPQEIEGFGPVFWGSVIFDEQENIFKCWHMGLTFHQPEIFNHLYLTSKNGIHWDKPKLDILGPDNRFNPPGYKVGHAGMWLTLRKDMDEPDPQHRYKGFIQHDPLWYVTSPDGLTWKDAGIAAGYTDDTTTVVYHPTRKEYLKIGRFCPDGSSIALRLMMTCTSPTPLIEGNSLWHLTTLPTEDDLLRDPYQQFYHMPAFAYGDLYIGLLGMYYAGPDNGNSDTELTFSRDGLDWHRLAPHEPFMPRGEKGQWDSGFGTLPGTGPIVRGDELWFYYSQYNNSHHGPFRNAAIGLATLRRDGFVSLTSAKKTARITTKPFKLLGNQVLINIKGTVRVALMDINGQTLAQSDPFNGDDCDSLTRWHDNKDLHVYRNRQVKLSFEWTGDLYAFEMADR
jgi:hypothetical protein